MISKELLIKVLKRDVSNVGGCYTSYSTSFCYAEADDIKCINNYELANMCKEWAYEQGYIINSRHDNTPALWEAYINLSLTVSHSEVANSEPEAIFKSCEWILKKEKK
jgi:hypothetical protein